MRADPAVTEGGDSIITIIYIYGMGGVWVQFLGDQVTPARVILVLLKCIWNAPTISLVLPDFDDTGTLGSPRQVVYPLVKWFHPG